MQADEAAQLHPGSNEAVLRATQPRVGARVYLRYRRSRLRHVVRRRVYAAFYQTIRLTLWRLRQVELTQALAIADRLGDLGYSAIPALRRLALAHAKLALGDRLSPAERENVIRASYRNSARMFAEMAKLDDIRARFDDYVSVEGWESFEEVNALGCGGIVVLGHVGNWELFAAYALSKGVQIAAIARHMRDPRLDRLLTSFRTGYGLRLIMRTSARAGAEILSVLKQHGILALHIDQDIPVPSVTVPFLGHPARTPVAAALFAIRRNVPAVVALCRRRPEGGHHFTLTPLIYPPKTGDRTRDIIEMTTQFSQILETRIRENPAEWMWWHRRWRRRPVRGLDLDAEPVGTGNSAQ